MLTIGIFSDLHPMDHITTGGVRLEGDCLYAIQQIEEYLNTIRLDAAFFREIFWMQSERTEVNSNC